MKKRLISMVFLVIWISQSIIAISFFYIEKSICFAEQHSLPNIHGKELHLIQFRKNDDIHWEHGHDEIVYQQHYYDVLYTFEKNNTTFIVCIADKKEDGLIAKYTDYLKGKSKRTGNSHSKSAPIQYFCHCIKQYEQSTFYFFTKENKTVYDFQSALFSQAIEIISPPPEC